MLGFGMAMLTISSFYDADLNNQIFLGLKELR
jgi:hypothetical protein